MSWYTFLADVLVTMHLGIVSFVLFGQIIILLGVCLGWQWVRNLWFRLAHLATIGIVVMESLFGYECPFTTWEHNLRIAAGQDASQGSFVGRLMHSLLFYQGPEWVFTVCYCVFGLLVLGTFLLAPPRWPWTKGPATQAPAARLTPSEQGLPSPHFPERIPEKEEAAPHRPTA